MNSLAIAYKLLDVTVKAIVLWLAGKGDEPPVLKHLGIPEVELVGLRQRAKAARELRPSDED